MTPEGLCLQVKVAGQKHRLRLWNSKVSANLASQEVVDLGVSWDG